MEEQTNCNMRWTIIRTGEPNKYAKGDRGQRKCMSLQICASILHVHMSLGCRKLVGTRI